MKKFFFFFCICLSFLVKAQQDSVVNHIRGTWITNVASNVLKSKENITEAVTKCKQNGLNHIFVVVWNNGVTMYPSKVVKKYIGIQQSPIYKNFDPIACIVEEGHKQGLKVHAWFEFGFSFSYKDTANIWAKKYPSWIGRKANNQLLGKNGFYWWNALQPEPQAFLQELVLEVVTKYDIDGIQGDDRMPAMPAEGGYDVFTRKLYFKETNSQVPTNPKDTNFINWKANKLSAFGKQIYQAVKKVKPTCWVTWAPSIYPWSKQEYLQDWPSWLKNGYADFVLPQLYRYKIEAYEKILLELNATIPSNLKHKVFPGILTSLGDGYQSSKELTKQMIQLNRKYGFNGEVFFYYETLNRQTGSFYE